MNKAIENKKTVYDSGNVELHFTRIVKFYPKNVYLPTIKKINLAWRFEGSMPPLLPMILRAIFDIFQESNESKFRCRIRF